MRLSALDRQPHIPLKARRRQPAQALGQWSTTSTDPPGQRHLTRVATQGWRIDGGGAREKKAVTDTGNRFRLLAVSRPPPAAPSLSRSRSSVRRLRGEASASARSAPRSVPFVRASLTHESPV